MALTSFIDIICTCAFHVQIFLYIIENLFAHANIRACADVHFLGLFRTAIRNRSSQFEPLLESSQLGQILRISKNALGNLKNMLLGIH